MVEDYETMSSKRLLGVYDSIAYVLGDVIVIFVTVHVEGVREGTT